jgi:NAD(P)-dependent dehydrogenase (short-subunit alcohol dehydrogenase family)
MTRTLITGANKGLGYETARRLLGEGHEVWMAARDPQRAASGRWVWRATRMALQDVRNARLSASKAALNMLTVKWAQAHPRWRVNAADPGYTATDLNAHRGLQTVSEGTDAIVALACLGGRRSHGYIRRSQRPGALVGGPLAAQVSTVTSVPIGV